GGGLRPSIASLADEISDSSHGAERDPERHHEAQAREAEDDAVGGERLRPRLRDPAGEDACRLKGPYLGRELERDGYAEGEDAPIAREVRRCGQDWTILLRPPQSPDHDIRDEKKQTNPRPS